MVITTNHIIQPPWTILDGLLPDPRLYRQAGIP